MAVKVDVFPVLSGITLAEDVYTTVRGRSVLLLREGAKLTPAQAQALKRRGIKEVKAYVLKEVIAC